jgi:hypothetical protein
VRTTGYGQVTQRDIYEADGTLVETSIVMYDDLGRTQWEAIGYKENTGGQWWENLGSGDERTATWYNYNDAGLVTSETIVHPDDWSQNISAPGTSTTTGAT